MSADDLMQSDSLVDVDSWKVNASDSAINTHNPIRAIVDHMKVHPNPAYETIKVSIGDPSRYGGFDPCQEILESVKESLFGMKHNGYLDSHGEKEAREAVARHHPTRNQPLTADDVILTCACSGALDICLRALSNPGQNVLIPRPGFSLYRTILQANAIQYREYKLQPEKSWEVDLEHLESLIDDRTTAILVTDPSNPCGSVFTKKHKLDIIDVAERHKKPIIADEVYDGMGFPGVEFHSFGSLSEHVPILSCGGLAKRFLVPGWRMGWIILHDHHDIVRRKVWERMISMTQVILGPCSVLQGALPSILQKTPEQFHSSLHAKLERHARLCFDRLSRVPGLTPVMPAGAMYMMVGIDVERFPEVHDDVQFSEKLFNEMSVHCLPGKCFNYPNFVRVVVCAAEDKLREACDRIDQFCRRHIIL